MYWRKYENQCPVGRIVLVAYRKGGKVERKLLKCRNGKYVDGDAEFPWNDDCLWMPFPEMPSVSEKTVERLRGC